MRGEVQISVELFEVGIRAHVACARSFKIELYPQVQPNTLGKD
jgi:hypothetical protein